MTTALKTCFKCGVAKSSDDFYRHPQMGDGRLGKCKECTKVDVRETRQKRLEYYRAYDRARGARQTPLYRQSYYEQNKDKKRASTVLYRAIISGRVRRTPCWQCGADQWVQGHHSAYDMPLDVVWLCSGCHMQLHRDFERWQRESRQELAEEMP